MANLFAYRATIPSDMMAAKDPIGEDNDRWLRTLADGAGIVIAAWGNEGAFLGRSKEIVAMFPELYCLKINGSGEPAHPLYQPGSAVPIAFN